MEREPRIGLRPEGLMEDFGPYEQVTVLVLVRVGVAICNEIGVHVFMIPGKPFAASDALMPETKPRYMHSTSNSENHITLLALQKKKKTA
jgi:hypothetical protein